MLRRIAATCCCRGGSPRTKACGYNMIREFARIVPGDLSVVRGLLRTERLPTGRFPSRMREKPCQEAEKHVAPALSAQARRTFDTELYGANQKGNAHGRAGSSCADCAPGLRKARSQQVLRRKPLKELILWIPVACCSNGASCAFHTSAGGEAHRVAALGRLPLPGRARGKAEHVPIEPGRAARGWR